jgi:hypothetical protein
MSFDAYKIAVSIQLTENVTRGLAAMTGGFKGAHHEAEGLQKRLDLLGKAALSVGIGSAGLAILKGPLDEAAKYQILVEKFKQQGGGAAALADAEKFAEASKIAGASRRDMLRNVVEAQGIFKDVGLKTVEEQLHAAKAMAPVLARMEVATNALSEERHKLSHAQKVSMLRVIEMQGGANSPERAYAIANATFKSAQSSGGTVDPEQIRQFIAKGGSAVMNMGDEAMYAKMEPIIAEMKGGRVGDGLNTAFSRLTGIIRVPNQVADVLMKNNIWDRSKVELNSQGGIKKFNGNPLMNSAMFQRDPIEHYEKIVKPMYEKMHLDAEGITRMNAMIYGRTGGAVFNLVEKQHELILKSVNSYRGAKGINETADSVGETYAGRVAAFHKKWDDLMLVIAKDGGLLDAATKVLTMLGHAVEMVTAFAKNHEIVTKFAVGLFAVGAAALFAGGTLAILRLGFGGLLVGLGPIALAVVGVTSALGALYAAMHFITESEMGKKSAAHVKNNEINRLNAQIASYAGLPQNDMRLKGLVQQRDKLVAQQAASQKPPSGSPNIRPGGPAVNVTVVNKVDERGITNMVTKNMANAMNRPNSSGPAFDYNAGFPQVALAR